MISQQILDPATQAVIAITDVDLSKTPPQKVTTEFIDTVAFTYSSDILQLGDPFTVVVPNPNGAYTGKLKAGSTVKLYLRNPKVQDNVRTLKALGVVVKRRVESSGTGTTIQLDCADLGWHLVNNSAPLWRGLYGNFTKLITDPAWIDPSWGIDTTNFRMDNEQNKKLKLNNGRAGVILSQQNIPLLTPLIRIQSEPGDKVADILITYARRLNYLINVACDGVFQLFRPDYEQDPLYHIEYHDQGEASSSPNNILSAHVEEDISGRWTQAICVGEVVISKILPDKAQTTGTQNATKFRGQVNIEKQLPFVHRLTFSDGEIFDSKDSAPLAFWRTQQDKYNSFRATYRVKGHHQDGIWWEADTMCSVNDTVNGLQGNYYVSSVTYSRDEQGDITEVNLRLPNLLQAYFEHPKRNEKIKTQNGIYLIKATI